MAKQGNEFIVNYDRLLAVMRPEDHLVPALRHFTKQQTATGRVWEVRVTPFTDPPTRVLWVYVDMVDPDGDLFREELWFREESGELLDLLEDLHEQGVVLERPEDIKGMQFEWEYKHGYSPRIVGANRT